MTVKLLFIAALDVQHCRDSEENKPAKFTCAVG